MAEKGFKGREGGAGLFGLRQGSLESRLSVAEVRLKRRSGIIPAETQRVKPDAWQLCRWPEGLHYPVILYPLSLRSVADRKHSNAHSLTPAGFEASAEKTCSWKDWKGGQPNARFSLGVSVSPMLLKLVVRMIWRSLSPDCPCKLPVWEEQFLPQPRGFRFLEQFLRENSSRLEVGLMCLLILD